MATARHSYTSGAGLSVSRLSMLLPKACGTGKNFANPYTSGFSIPSEILLEIAHSMPSPRDIIPLCLTSKEHHKFLLPALYRSVEFKTLERCQERLKFLIGRPDLARYIQSFVLRPCNVQSEADQEVQALAAEREIVRAIELLAPNLIDLRKFIWDGQQMPEDSLWRTLRMSCPHLHYVGSSVGTEEIKPESQLFAFDDLLGFSFITKWHELDFHAMPPLGPVNSERLPETMWDMLVARSPRLEELILGGKGSFMTTRLLDVRPVTRGRWSALRQLTLGTVLVLDRDASDSDKEQITVEFSEFLSDHPNLKQFDTPYHNRLPALDIKHSDIVLETYSGSLPYLIDILPVCNLKQLSLCAEEHAAWYIPYVRKVLKILPSLTSLQIWIDLTYHFDPKEPEKNDAASEQRDHIAILRGILSECPKLEHFKVVCSTKKKLTFPMKELPNAFIGAPALKSFEIYKVYSTSGEEQMIQTATRMFRQLPSLEYLTLRYSKIPWSTLTKMKLRQTGSYDVILRGETGQPVRALAHELGYSLFKRLERRYEHDLRPLHNQILSTVSRRI